MRGWEKAIYKHEPNHDPMNPYYLNKSYGDKYTIYNEESVTGTRYWDSNENNNYYSLSKYQRAKLYIKELFKVINYDYIILHIILLITLSFYARKKAEQMI